MKNDKLIKFAILFSCLPVLWHSVSSGSESNRAGDPITVGAIAGAYDADGTTGFGGTEDNSDCKISTNVYHFPVLDRFGNAAQPGCFFRSEDDSPNKDCRPDNGFGKDVRSLPTDWSGMIDTGVTLHSCVWNIPVRDWTSGFPFPAAARFDDARNRGEWFALRYQGEFEVIQPGAYEFRITSDDGSILIIDDYLVIENDKLHSMQAGMGLMDLAAGFHKLDLQYFQGPRTHLGLVVEVKRPGSEDFEIFDARLPL